ncbi:hypothetical protein SAMN02787118_109251 [Streptomyces mirabilis]|jgi:hypothetical protein|uniref:Uncharacterized protein n=1 Tax=Streptomyces mirabilis TaxID=68239 RepID=A0A1I2K2D8_9ACTN|nr:hypothetical protein SAMN02787118_109251 [Streptomyces mirabilis]
MGRRGMRPLPITDNSAGIRRQSGDTTQGESSERAAVSPVLVPPISSVGMRPGLRLTSVRGGSLLTDCQRECRRPQSG